MTAPTKKYGPPKTIKIDSAPLVASPEPSGNVIEVELLHVLGDQLYVCPPKGSPLYVHKRWLRDDNYKP